MHVIMRTAGVLAVGAVLSSQAQAETQTEYRQADSSYYLRGEVFLADPSAPVVAPGNATNIGSSYLISTRGQAPRFVYLPETHDWIEPITPPSEPANLNIAPTAMQVREPYGSVQVALASAPAHFEDVEKGMTIPNGSTLRTGDSGSVAVLFGGVDSVRLAPNTLATVQMTLAGGLRDVEVDVRSGMVFSKVGQHADEKQHYAVHTPNGDATAHGTDYVTVVYPQRTDVWVAQGTVELKGPDGSDQMTVSTGHEPLRVMRHPLAASPTSAMAESAESLTALLNFIPMANRKLAALDKRRRDGAELTAQEKDYVGRIRQVVAVVRLANVNVVPEPAAAPKPIVEASLPVHPAPRAQLVALPPKPAASKVAKTVSKAVIAAKPVAVAQRPLKPSTLAQTKPPAEKSIAAANGATKTKIPILAPPAETNKTLTSGVTAKVKPAKLAKTTAKQTKTAKPVALVAKDKTKLGATEHYLRAQPVNAADLVESPGVRTVPPVAPPPAQPPEKEHVSAEADPNSLGAPLNPLRPMLAPPAAEHASTQTIGSSGP